MCDFYLFGVDVNLPIYLAWFTFGSGKDKEKRIRDFSINWNWFNAN